MSESQAVALQYATDERVSDRVLEAVAEYRGSDPLEFSPPLYEVIDPDALDALFRGGGIDGSVEFTYLGCRITVRGDGEISIRETGE